MGCGNCNGSFFLPLVSDFGFGFGRTGHIYYTYRRHGSRLAFGTERWAGCLIRRVTWVVCCTRSLLLGPGFYTTVQYPPGWSVRWVWDGLAVGLSQRKSWTSDRSNSCSIFTVFCIQLALVLGCFGIPVSLSMCIPQYGYLAAMSLSCPIIMTAAGGFQSHTRARCKWPGKEPRSTARWAERSSRLN